MLALPNVDGTAQLFADRYRVIRRLGTGRTATTFLAIDVWEGRRVALKLIRSRRLDDPAVLSRMTIAALDWARTDHPNLVALLDFGSASPDAFPEVSPRFYLALEYVPGRSLAWHAQARGPLPIRWSVRVVREILAGLDALHRAGQVHLDLTPRNVLVTPDGGVKVADPLIASALGYSRPDYLSPEQITGQPATAASDLYSAGVILYELLADIAPFRGGSARAVMARHISEPPISPRLRRAAVPERLAAISLRSLEKHPTERYPGAAELSDALASFISSEPERSFASEGNSQVAWTPLPALSESEVAPTPRQIAPPPRIQLDWGAMAQVVVIVAFLLASLAIGSGRQLMAPAVSLDEEERVRSSQPTPTRTPVPTPGPPVVVIFEPLFATPSAATRTPIPTATEAAVRSTPTTTSSAPAAARKVDCPAPTHANAAIAEAVAALVAFSCGSALENEVSAVIALAGEKGTEVRFEQPTTAVWGYYDTAANRISLAPLAANEPAATRAALLFHELIHVRDHFQGGLIRESGVLGCYDVELRAFSAQAVFWRLVRADIAGARVQSPLAVDLDSIAAQIEKDPSEFVARDLVGRYGTSCSPRNTE